MKVIGAEIKSGEYKGHEYCNVFIHGTDPVKADRGVGEVTRFEKVKYSKLCEILGVDKVDGSVITKRLIGKDLEFGFDRYQNVNYITEFSAGKAV